MSAAIPRAAMAARKSFLAGATSGVVEAPHRVFLYGVPGIGKTTFGADAPKPFFLDLQSGSTRMNVTRAPGVETFDDVKAAIEELTNEEHPFETLVIDTVDDLEGKIWNHICKRDGQENITAYGYGKGYDVAFDEWRLLVAHLERLQRRKNMRVILIGHSQTTVFKNPEGPDYERYSPSINAKAGGLLVKWCDTVLFARQEIYVATDKKTKRTRGVATDLHVMHTSRTAAYDAKNRDQLPETMTLDWSEFSAGVVDKAQSAIGDIQAEIEGLMESIPESKRDAVKAAITDAGDNAAKLARVLNKARATVKAAEGESVA